MLSGDAQAFQVSVNPVFFADDVWVHRLESVIPLVLVFLVPAENIEAPHIILVLQPQRRYLVIYAIELLPLDDIEFVLEHLDAARYE